MKTTIHLLIALGALIFASTTTRAEDLTPEAQKKVDAVIKEAQQWASDPIIVKAVKDQNEKGLPAAYADMTQEKWNGLSILDPLVRDFTKNAATDFLKTKKTDAITATNLSDAKGYKVAFLAKTKYWCHKGVPQHETAMSGKTWQGPLEVHSATGKLQVLVSVPVLDGATPIGSLIVGVSAAAIN